MESRDWLEGNTWSSTGMTILGIVQKSLLCMTKREWRRRLSLIVVTAQELEAEVRRWGCSAAASVGCPGFLPGQ